MIRLLAFVFLLAVAIEARHEKYEGHHLYRIWGQTEQIGYLEGYLDLLSVTPAQRSESRKLEALVRLSPEERVEWLPYFNKNQMGYRIVSDNLAQILRAKESEVGRAKNLTNPNSTITWDAYYNTEAINKYIDEIGAKYPDLVTVINAGLSYEGRQIKYDRMWRKTRSRSHEGADNCPGVDGNRNFDHHWGTRPSSADPCSLIYEGPSPFSEPEIRVIRDAVLSNLQRTALSISLHSHGNMFLYAWGNNGTLPSNGLYLHLVGIQMATAIDNLKLDKAPNYIVGNAANVLYFTSGTSRDWTRAIGIPLTYTMELPGYDYGFLVPPKYIKQIVTESWAGFVAGARSVLSSR